MEEGGEMGEIADDMVNGACCSWCSQYFVEEHGYPVLCRRCFSKATREERKGFQQAINKET